MRFSKRKYPLLDIDNWFNFKIHEETIFTCVKDRKDAPAVAKWLFENAKPPKTGLFSYVSQTFMNEALKNQDKLLEYRKEFEGKPYFFITNRMIYAGVLGKIMLGFMGDHLVSYADIYNKPEIFIYDRNNISIPHAEFQANIVYWPYAIYLFKHFAETKTKILPAKKKIDDFHCKYKSDLDIDIELLTENWYTQSCQNHPFIVRGHWRMQACGPALSERKLKWIDAFWKEGYKKGAYMDQ
jgi:hypothetical protein